MLAIRERQPYANDTHTHAHCRCRHANTYQYICVFQMYECMYRSAWQFQSSQMFIYEASTCWLWLLCHIYALNQFRNFQCKNIRSIFSIFEHSHVMADLPCQLSKYLWLQTLNESLMKSLVQKVLMTNQRSAQFMWNLLLWYLVFLNFWAHMWTRHKL